MSGAQPFQTSLDAAINGFALCELGAGVRLVRESREGQTIHIVLQGTMHAETDGASFVAAAGTTVLLPPHSRLIIAADRNAAAVNHFVLDRLRHHCGLPIYSGGGSQKLRVLMGRISPSAVAALGLASASNAPVLSKLRHVPAAAAMAKALDEEISTPLVGAGMLAAALLKTCLVHAARTVTRLPGTQASSAERALTAILADPAAAHNIEALAKLTNLSRSTFVRHFVQLTRMSPMEFVGQARLKHAAEQLRTTSLPVKVIAAQSGFQSSSHFSRAFRDRFGVNPGAFREAIDPRPEQEIVMRAATPA